MSLDTKVLPYARIWWDQGVVADHTNEGMLGVCGEVDTLVIVPTPPLELLDLEKRLPALPGLKARRIVLNFVPTTCPPVDGREQWFAGAPPCPVLDGVAETVVLIKPPYDAQTLHHGANNLLALARVLDPWREEDPPPAVDSILFVCPDSPIGQSLRQSLPRLYPNFALPNNIKTFHQYFCYQSMIHAFPDVLERITFMTPEAYEARVGAKAFQIERGELP
jgi:hypothetical protein